MFEHSLGILSEAEDAPIRDHIQGCDACRADGAELLIITERLREFGVASDAPGREAFADRTRYDVRGAMGDSRGSRATSSWRVTSGITESQRMRRMAVRRRNTIAKMVGVIVGAVVTPILVMVLAYATGLIDYTVDTYGNSIEALVGIDLAGWGFRPTYEDVAARAASTSDASGLAVVGEDIDRLLKWELGSPTCRMETVAALELASLLARNNDVGARNAIAAAIRHGSAVAPRPEEINADALTVIKRARSSVMAGDAHGARAALELLVISGLDLALYYDAVAGCVLTNDASMKQFGRAVADAPLVGLEVAVRNARTGNKRAAIDAMKSAPAGALRDAVATFLAN
jgi:hypothetical protein